MTLPEILFDTKAAIIKPFINPDLYSITAMDHTNHYKPWAIPKILKTDPGLFAAALAHEVRNPLTNINLSVKLLESAIKDDDLKVYLDIIMRSSIRINNLIKEFLKYQLPDKVLSEKYSIHKLLDEIIEMTEDRILLKNIIVKRNYATLDFKMLLNRPKMRIALTNIIINAIDSMNTEKGELQITTKSVEGKYIIQIEDNGCGISPHNLEKIFTPYFTDKPGGFGIGLSTTYDILKSDQVDVHVESEEGKGTRFILSFQLATHQ